MKTLVLAVIISTILHFMAPAFGSEPERLKVAHVNGVIDESSLFTFLIELQETADIPGDRVVYIDSPGGYVTSYNSMLAAMEAEKADGVKYTCVVTKSAASMAFSLLSHCDTRIADTHAILLFHKVAPDSLPLGMRITAKNLREVAAILEATDLPYSQYNATVLGMSLEDYDLYADSDTYWAAGTLLSLGYLQAVGSYADAK